VDPRLLTAGAIADHLAVPHALRTLSPFNPRWSVRCHCRKSRAVDHLVDARDSIGGIDPRRL